MDLTIAGWETALGLVPPWFLSLNNQRPRPMILRPLRGQTPEVSGRGQGQTRFLTPALGLVTFLVRAALQFLVQTHLYDDVDVPANVLVGPVAGSATKTG